MKYVTASHVYRHFYIKLSHGISGTSIFLAVHNKLVERWARQAFSHSRPPIVLSVANTNSLNANATVKRNKARTQVRTKTNSVRKDKTTAAATAGPDVA